VPCCMPGARCVGLYRCMVISVFLVGMHAFHPARQMDVRVESTLVFVGWCVLHCIGRDSRARLHAARNALWIGCVGCSRIPHGARGALRVARRARWGRRADAFAERAARCTGAQDGHGGLIRMDKGAALFDGVAISGTEAWVRAGGHRWVSGPMRVGGAGAV
jgi:hypothetical protein